MLLLFMSFNEDCQVLLVPFFQLIGEKDFCVATLQDSHQVAELFW